MKAHLPFTSVCKCQPHLPRHLIKRRDLIADQLARPVVLGRHAALDKYLVILVQNLLIFVVGRRENEHLDRAYQVLDSDERHHLVRPCILDRLVNDHTADDLARTVHDLRLVGLLVQHEVAAESGYPALHDVAILLERMPGDVDAEHFFFKCQLLLP